MMLSNLFLSCFLSTSIASYSLSSLSDSISRFDDVYYAQQVSGYDIAWMNSRDQSHITGVYVNGRDESLDHNNMNVISSQYLSECYQDFFLSGGNLISFTLDFSFAYPYSQTESRKDLGHFIYDYPPYDDYFLLEFGFSLTFGTGSDSGNYYLNPYVLSQANYSHPFSNGDVPFSRPNGFYSVFYIFSFAGGTQHNMIYEISLNGLDSGIYGTSIFNSYPTNIPQSNVIDNLTILFTCSGNLGTIGDDFYNNGFSTGRQVGYVEGQNSNTNILNLFSGMADIPFITLRSLFNFTLFGQNFYILLMSVLTLLLFVFLIKWFIRK